MSEVEKAKYPMQKYENGNTVNNHDQKTHYLEYNTQAYMWTYIL